MILSSLWDRDTPTNTFAHCHSKSANVFSLKLIFIEYEIICHWFDNFSWLKRSPGVRLSNIRLKCSNLIVIHFRPCTCFCRIAFVCTVRYLTGSGRFAFSSFAYPKVNALTSIEDSGSESTRPSFISQCSHLVSLSALESMMRSVSTHHLKVVFITEDQNTSVGCHFAFFCLFAYALKSSRLVIRETE